MDHVDSPDTGREGQPPLLSGFDKVVRDVRKQIAGGAVVLGLLLPGCREDESDELPPQYVVPSGESESEDTGDTDGLSTTDEGTDGFTTTGEDDPAETTTDGGSTGIMSESSTGTDTGDTVGESTETGPQAPGFDNLGPDNINLQNDPENPEDNGYVLSDSSYTCSIQVSNADSYTVILTENGVDTLLVDDEPVVGNTLDCSFDTPPTDGLPMELNVQINGQGGTLSAMISFITNELLNPVWNVS